MNIFYFIRKGFIWITQVFVDMAMDAYDWPLVGSWLGNGFRDLSDFTAYIAGILYDGEQWWTDVENRLGDVLSWYNIKTLIRDWLPFIDAAIQWYENAWANIWVEINTWWPSVETEIKSWIASATDGIESLISQVESWLSNLQSAWDNFTSTILPTLTNLTDVDNLIASWFTNFTPFWEGWLDWKDSVAEFFADPLQWLYDKMDEWFERFW